MKPFLLIMLEKVILSVIAERFTVTSNIEIFECDNGRDSFEPFGGVQAAREMLLFEHEQKTQFTAILIVGIRALPIREHCFYSGESSLLDLLEWPGAAYLQYGFDKDELCTVVCRIIEGAKAPLPDNLLISPRDVLRIASGIRHWLDNKLKSTYTAMADFRAAAEGDKILHRSHLEPTQAIDKGHRQMLDRLLSMDIYIEGLIATDEILNDVRKSLLFYESSFNMLEEARTKCTGEINQSEKSFQINLFAIVERFKAVYSALNKVICAIKNLEHQIEVKYFKKKGA